MTTGARLRPIPLMSAAGSRHPPVVAPWSDRPGKNERPRTIRGTAHRSGQDEGTEGEDSRSGILRISTHSGPGGSRALLDGTVPVGLGLATGLAGTDSDPSRRADCAST